jgi:hypothetical protein
MEQLSPRLIKIITHISVFGEVSAKELLPLVVGSRTVLSREVAVLNFA